MNIKTQQYLGACISAAIVLLVGVAFFVASQRVNQATDRSNLASEIVIGISELRSLTFEYILHHHERPRVQWQQRHDTVVKLLAGDAFEDTAQQQTVNLFRQRHQDLKETFSRLTQHYASGGNGRSDPAETALSRELEARLIGQLLATSQEMISVAFRLVRASESEEANTQRWAGMLAVLAITLMALIVLANTVLSIRYILKPIGQLKRGIEIIGDGDLSYCIGITSSNEFGALSQAFDRMTTRVLESRAALEAERVNAARREVIMESEARYRRIVDSVAEGIISIDETLRIVLFNPAAAQLFGRSSEEMNGQPLSALVPERFRAQHDEHTHRFAATGETNRAMGQYGLIYGLRASGEEFPLEATISKSGISPKKLLTVILRDVTERMRVEQAQREHAEQLRLLSRRLFETEEIARRRLARELHDRIGQNVTALSLNLNLVRSELPADTLQKVSPRLNDCESLLYYTAQLVRDIQVDLRPPGLDALGLVAALNEHARQVAGRTGIKITVSGTELAPRLPPASEITLFRIVQEALNNISKHAQATEVTIALEANPDAVVLNVADNGRGFDAVARPEQATRSLGMVSMRERAESIGGQLRVESAPGAGTRVIVEAPRVAASST